jgi:dATP pyrophosphohydrolase
MAELRVGTVDVYVIAPGAAVDDWRVLVLQRSQDTRCPGAWETVHGHIEAGETPAEAATRELLEETGLTPEKLYNLSRVETFYQHRLDEVALVPVFAAFVPREAAVTTGGEHDRFEWLPPVDARRRFAWPREARALDDILTLLGSGHAGAVEDVLRVC